MQDSGCDADTLPLTFNLPGLLEPRGSLTVRLEAAVLLASASGTTACLPSVLLSRLLASGTAQTEAADPGQRAV